MKERSVIPRKVSQAGVLVALAIASAATVAQTTLPEERFVRRPDGTIIAPFGEGGREPSRGWWTRESPARADQRERLRLDAQREYADRLEARARERAAAQQNPARQITPPLGQ